MDKNKQIFRDRTKTMRVNLKDWLFLDDFAGQEKTLATALHELVEEYKEVKGLNKTIEKTRS